MHVQLLAFRNSVIIHFLFMYLSASAACCFARLAGSAGRNAPEYSETTAKCSEILPERSELSRTVPSWRSTATV